MQQSKDTLGKELIAQADIAKKQYQKLDNTSEFDKIIKRENLTIENYSKSDLIYNSRYGFQNYYHNDEKFNNLSIKSKYSLLVKFFNNANKFNKLKTQKEKTQKKKANVYDTASELYIELLETYFDEYNDLEITK